MYKTIEECQKDVQRFSMEIDIHYAGVYNLFDIIMAIIDVFITPLYYGTIALDAACYFKYYNISKESLFILNIFTVGFILCKSILNKTLSKSIIKDHIQTKLNIGLKCFENYEGYEELADSEKSEIFEKQICSCLGLIKIK